jgi:TRAP-type C4-dicarboxylate transport system permease small subunit
MSGRALQRRGPLDRLAAVALAGAGAALVLLALVEAWQVFARYVLERPPAWTEPIALLCLKCALMLGAAVGVRSESHFRFPLAVQAARGFAKAALEAASRLAAAALGAALAGWGAAMMIATWPLKIPGAPLSSAWYFAPFVVGGALFVVFALERLLFEFETAAEAD